VHASRHVEDVTLEVDDTVKLFVSASTMTRGNSTINITASGLVAGLGEGTLRTFFGQTLAFIKRGESAGGRKWAE
jgi:hypothetical protein